MNTLRSYDQPTQIVIDQSEDQFRNAPQEKQAPQFVRRQLSRQIGRSETCVPEPVYIGYHPERQQRAFCPNAIQFIQFMIESNDKYFNL